MFLFLLIIGMILIFISELQISGTQYSASFAEETFLIGSILIILSFLLK